MAHVFLSPQARSVHFAVRPAVVGKHLGLLLLPLAGLTLVPLTVSWIAGSAGVAWRYGLVVVLLAGAGWPLSRIRCTTRIQTNEALVVTALVFVLSGLLMSLPMQALEMAPIDAVFESVSGVTTTGLSTLSTIEDRSPAFLFGRAWLQWIGGLGVVVLALALVIQPGVASKRLGFGDREMDDVVGGTRAHARRVMAVYVVLSALGVAALMAVGTQPLTAVVHSLAAVSTGGFARHDTSLIGLGVSHQAVVTALSFAGAVSFSVYYSGLYRRPLEVLQDRQLRAFVLAGLVSALVVLLCVRMAGDSSTSAWDAVTTAFSAQTTAGFSTLPIASLPDTAKVALAASMLVGGEGGSTAGGIKVLRALIVVRLLLVFLQEASISRRARPAIQLDGRRLGGREIRGTVAVIAAYALVVFLSWMAFLVFGHDPVDSLFEVASATATAGLSTGISAPDLHGVLKGVLAVDMLLGRVETVALLMVFFPPTWFGKRRSIR